ncbi:hypothetical protein B5C34_09400 [Pacificimonas flava]|uniref:DUF3089 domain-containing protein n=2 Tax=Pacificimonas TaxID=1960290 RepID=A0A219B670_9SPHN|nr:MULTISPECIES: DUF3089 domain-containing protein [Pacificimonas]MBZ6379115.1 DUF3089 domain-containing protein [Pacificimonas aurantium]OWV33653.1 hypothetical protein B5C34_09400 [Pacificimonas flava]
MAARIFLWSVFGLISLAVAAAILWAAAGGWILRQYMAPSVSFEESPKAPPTFYDRPDAWIARPGLPSEEARWLPDGVFPKPDAPAAIFYVHPTTYLGSDRWNAPIDVGSEDARFRRRVFTQSQASAFTVAGDVWAPKYRQAAFGAFLNFSSPDAEKAFALASSDVSKAFEEFMNSTDPGQPIILVGHSQGAFHLASLLAERGEDEELRSRLVAAYLIGWPISETADLPAMNITPCREPRQVRCLLAYQSFGEPADPSLIFDAFDQTNGFTGEPRRNTQLLCTNPVTGGSTQAAAASENIGTLVPEESLLNAHLEPGLVGGTCTDRGYLVLTQDPPDMGSYVLPGNNYHVYDIPLFWANLRADAQERTTAFAQ